MKRLPEATGEEVTVTYPDGHVLGDIALNPPERMVCFYEATMLGRASTLVAAVRQLLFGVLHPRTLRFAAEHAWPNLRWAIARHSAPAEWFVGNEV